MLRTDWSTVFLFFGKNKKREMVTQCYSPMAFALLIQDDQKLAVDEIKHNLWYHHQGSVQQNHLIKTREERKQKNKK